MDYFVDSWNNNFNDWASKFTDTNKLLVCRKFYDINYGSAAYGEYKCTLSAINTVTPHTLYTQGYPPNGNVGTALYEQNTLTGSLQDGSNNGIVKYGEYTDGDYDMFTFFVDKLQDGAGGANVPCHLTTCVWKDNRHEYMMQLYRTNGTTPANYTSFLSDNTSVTTSNSTFPLVKDVNLTTAYRQLGAPSANYVFQPVTVFGIKAPIYIVAGGHDSDLPWFTEIQVGEDKFFTIDGNYAIKL
jgi:hypothetical protein